MKVIEGEGLITYKPLLGIRLTKTGKFLARRVLRRPELVKCFLCETVGLSPDEADRESDRMPSSVSEFVLKTIEQYLRRLRIDEQRSRIPLQ